MTAPSIKEALELARNALVALRTRLKTEPSVQGRGWVSLGIVTNDAIEKADRALATFQPDGERREAIARILADPKHQERARYVQGFLYGDDHVIRDVALRENQELFRTKDEHEYEQRLEIEKAKFAADAILTTSGLVQDEAGIREKERLEAVAWAAQGLLNADTFVSDVPRAEAISRATVKLQQALGTWQMHHTQKAARNGGTET